MLDREGRGGARRARRARREAVVQRAAGWRRRAVSRRRRRLKSHSLTAGVIRTAHTSRPRARVVPRSHVNTVRFPRYLEPGVGRVGSVIKNILIY